MVRESPILKEYTVLKSKTTPDKVVPDRHVSKLSYASSDSWSAKQTFMMDFSILKSCNISSSFKRMGSLYLTFIEHKAPFLPWPSQTAKRWIPSTRFSQVI